MRYLVLPCLITLFLFTLEGKEKKIELVYPSVKSIENIETFYLRGEKALEKRKELVLKEFTKEFHQFLKKDVAKESSSDLLQHWDYQTAKISTLMNLCSAMTLVEPNDELRKAYGKVYLELREKLIETLSSDQKVYSFFLSIAAKETKVPTLKPHQKYFLDQLLLEMRQEGLHLDDQKREKLKELKKELGELSHHFAENIQEDQSALWVEKSALTGLKDDFIHSVLKNDLGLCRLGCDYPTYFTVMKSCENQKLRQDLYRLFMNRAYPNNQEILMKMVARRDELAKIIGFSSYAHYQLSSEMIKDPTAAENFLDDLTAHLQKKIDDEIKILKENFPDINLVDGKIHPWDALYLQEKLLAKAYQVDEDVVKEYFPLESTLEGLIKIYEKFFEISIEPLKGITLWSEDVKVLAVKNQSKKDLGYIIMDLHPRRNKYSHACHATIVGGIENKEGLTTKSLGLVVANFPKPTKEIPSLMNLSDARTFFHEFGHALHAVLGRTEYVLTSGTSVKVDFVELPSQMLEEWLWEPSILKMISSHYLTSEPLSDEMIESITSARTLNSAAFIARQCLLSKLSLRIYGEGKEKNVDQLMKELHAEVPLFYSYDEMSHFHASFGHLDEYGARYYGYLWSRVLALDLFDHIKKEGLLSSEVGKVYVQKVIGKGGSQDPFDLIEDFLGRKPSSEAFFKAYGL